MFCYAMVVCIGEEEENSRGDCNTGLPYRVRILFKKEKRI